MAETVRLRLVFEDRGMLSKSKKKQGLKRCWFLLKPQHTTISDVASHLFNTFRLHHTCPHGIVLSMDGFVLPSFESTCILKDKDIVCVKRRGSVSTDDNKPAMLPPAACEDQSIELPKLLTIEGLQEESGGEETMSQKDGDDQIEDAVYVESESDGNVVSKKRKASKKLKSPSQKKIKLSTAENLSFIPEVHEEENGSSEGDIHHQTSVVKKDKKKPSNLSSQSNKSSNLNKQKNDKSDPTSDETRFVQPQDESETKKLPSRSARRKKAKRRWLRELKLENEKKEKEKLHQTPVLEKNGQELPIKDNNCVVSDVHQQPDEESGEEDDIVPVEIRPGHIRFESLKKDQDQAVTQDQFPVETFQWNGITNKKKGQKWGKERMSFRKQDGYEHSSQDCPTVQNAEKKQPSNALDFDKLKPYYTSLPEEGDVIAYRLIELTASWTPELSSFRVGKISRYDAKSNRIWLEPVLEYPFDFKKKIDEDASSVQYNPSPYQENGSLEIEYTSLADVRMVKHGNPDLDTIVVSSDAWVKPTKATNDITKEKLAEKVTNGSSTEEKLAADQTTMESCQPERGHITAKENGEVNVWDEINEALKAKKAKLSKEDGWSRGGESSSTRSWSHRAMRCSALGPTMALLRSNNGL